MKPSKVIIDDVLYFRKNAIAQEIKLYEKFLSEHRHNPLFLNDAIKHLRLAMNGWPIIFGDHQVLYVSPSCDIGPDVTDAWREKAKMGVPGSPWHRLCHRAADFADYINGRQWRGG